MTEQILNVNNYNFPRTAVFHFKHSLRPFTLAYSFIKGGPFFISLEEGIAYTYEDLKVEGLKFYTKKKDPDFLGVAVMGEVAY